MNNAGNCGKSLILADLAELAGELGANALT
jgi:hypothetical protein